MFQIDFTKGNKKLSNKKYLCLILIGIVGLYVFAIFATLIASNIPGIDKPSRSGAIQFISYSFLFIALLAVVNTDIVKFKVDFTKFKPLLVGILLGAAMILFSFLYQLFINLFIEVEPNENEESLRNFITVFPVASILFLGIIGPICEELTYRVGLFGILSFNKIIAYVVGVLVFAFMHFTFDSAKIVNELIQLPNYIVSGFLMYFAYDKFGFGSSLFAHMTNNLWAVGSYLVLSKIG